MFLRTYGDTGCHFHWYCHHYLLFIYILLRAGPGPVCLVAAGAVHVRIATRNKHFNVSPTLYFLVFCVHAPKIEVQVVFSLVSMAVGFQYLVSGANCVMWSKLSALLSVLSLFTLAVKVSYIGFLADKEPSIFISQSASDKEVYVWRVRWLFIAFEWQMSWSQRILSSCRDTLWSILFVEECSNVIYRILMFCRCWQWKD